MTDAELIYNALLRAERRFEDKLNALPKETRKTSIGLYTALTVVRVLREEVGGGINDAYPR